MTLNRHNVREVAFQALFILSSMPEMSSEEALRQVLDLYDEEQIPEYLQFLITGVKEQQANLDAQITPYLKKGWTLQRIGRAESVILRLGLFEIQNSSAVPNKVAINEALQLVDQYSDPSSKKFVNAILSHFVNEVIE
ncbi:transcription antitermination factor NusB [Bombilactobacillus thymidiniphilus]|uniref:Transcription antitermination protein NusB n=1 Tax=Bombilactobacillus thymidiniphilus TaxID=2923363 RepID=A0ABY4PCG0_9LACO|nr:transcription antitermination factor NusB [Bombilactobacillus thymidiniphilus]UQS83448.1 transcription antitermination factor NusB [Bombilactobacillus thymidiniphilus]